MKIKYSRFHKTNPQQYESHDFGATIEIDTEVDSDFDGMGMDEIRNALDEELDILLDTAVTRALKLGGSMEESHIIDYYER